MSCINCRGANNELHQLPKEGKVEKAISRPKYAHFFLQRGLAEVVCRSLASDEAHLILQS